MNKKPKPNDESPNANPPEMDPRLGDLTPEYILWHKATHSEAEHFANYNDRIPYDYPNQHGIDLV